jgi:hypothetical protein
VTLHANTDLQCSLQVATTAIPQADSQSALRDSLIPASSFYDIEIPIGWLGGAADARLSIHESRASTHALAQAHHVSDSSPTLCRFDVGTGKWSPCTTIGVGDDSASINWQCMLLKSGIYGLFVRAFSMDSGVQFVALPNPVRMRRDSRMAIRGSNIIELWIYTVDGTLLAHGIKGQNNQPNSLVESAYGFDWRLCNASGVSVPPGVYFARIGYKDPVTRGMKKQIKKIFVIP